MNLIKQRIKNFLDTNKKKILIICNPFGLQYAPNKKNVSFAFSDQASLNLFRFLDFEYDEIFIEESLLGNSLKLKFSYKVIPNFVITENAYTPRVLFAPSNDTHSYLLSPLRSYFHSRFVIPHPESKNENALSAMVKLGINPIQLKYNQETSEEILEFSPHFTLCGNDWSTEFKTLNCILKKNKLGPFGSVQEGPQDWDSQINGVSPKKYLNNDFFFAQGPVTLKYIKPRFFSITGNSKTDHMHMHPLPPRPKVFINCNFTYGNWEDARDQWLYDVTSTCQKLSLDYVISQHPRDKGLITDPHIIKSSAASVNEQLKDCSIAVSRFSLIPLEALASGRHCIYYNPHRECPKSFNEDPTNGVFKSYNVENLYALLLKHKQNPAFDQTTAINTLEYHCGLIDEGATKRMASVINGIINNKIDYKKFNKVLKNI